MKTQFTINAQDIAAANMGWMLSQLLLGIIVKHKMIPANEAKVIYHGMAEMYRKSARPDRAEIREAALSALEPLIRHYDIPPPNQQH